MNPICTASFFCRLALALLVVPSADAAVAPPVNAFFQTYCIDCHGPQKQKGDFRVDELKISATAADAENRQLVLDNLQLGEMPPKDEKQPKQADVEQVTSFAAEGSPADAKIRDSIPLGGDFKPNPKVGAPSEVKNAESARPETLARLIATAAQAHQPVRERSFASTDLHERDRRSKYGKHDDDSYIATPSTIRKKAP